MYRLNAEKCVDEQVDFWMMRFSIEFDAMKFYHFFISIIFCTTNRSMFKSWVFRKRNDSVL